MTAEDTASPRPKKRPLLSPQFVQAMLAGHSALGLAFAALIYIVCLTGTVCVFIHELHRWEQPNTPVIETIPSAEVVDRLARNAYAQGQKDGGIEELFISVPSPFSRRILASYQDHATGTEGEWIADAEGNLAAREQAPWSEFIGALHMYLHLPRAWGMFIVGLTGVALLSSLISGVLAHPRIFKDAFALRWGGSRRLQEADLHNRLGVWGLPFHVVVSLTGALLGLSTLVVGVLALAAYDGDSEKAFAALLGPHPVASAKTGAVPAIGPMIETIRKQKPNAELVSVQYHHVGEEKQIVYVGMKTPGHLALFNSYYFDADGKAMGDGGLEEGGIGQQILGVLQPLHFGWFGGIGAKIFYGIIGIALTIVTESGVVIWLARKRDKGQPAPKWELIWAAVVWGQPLALAVAAIAAVVGMGDGVILATYLAITALTVVAALVMTTAARVTLTLKGLTAIALSVLAATHTWVWYAIATDPMALWGNAAIVAVAMAILLMAFNGLTAERRRTAIAQT